MAPAAEEPLVTLDAINGQIKSLGSAQGTLVVLTGDAGTTLALESLTVAFGPISAKSSM